MDRTDLCSRRAGDARIALTRRRLFPEQAGRWSTVGIGALMMALAATAAVFGAHAAAGAAPAVGVAAASTAQTAHTSFSPSTATATCPSGTTLVGGGDELTNDGAPTGTSGGTPPLSTTPVSNDGDVTLGVYPSDASGTQSSQADSTPASWTAAGGYSGEAPGDDDVTSFAMCATGVSAATVVEVSTSAPNSLGPVTSVCPSGDSLLGGGGGYTGFTPGVNAKLLDGYPSDPAGDVPSDGATNPAAWTVKGNSNSVSGVTTTAIALCATDVEVPTQVATGFNSASPVPSGSTVAATATCPAGTTLLDGGSEVASTQNGQVGGPGNGGQGVHVIGDYPSDAAAALLTSGPASWTLIAEDGGQILSTLDTEAFALCAQGAGDQLQALAAFVSGIGPGKSLSAKVQAAIGQFDAGNNAASCGILGSLINEVDGQDGKQLPAVQATAIVAAARPIQNILGC